MISFFEWLNESVQSINIDVSGYEGELKRKFSGYKDDGIVDEISNLVKKSEENMGEIRSIISDVISGISSWRTKDVTIKALFGESIDGDILPSNSADIYLGDISDKVFFMVTNHDGRMMVDDVLEGGDKEFFKSEDLQSDYFELVNGLKNYGNNNVDRVLTLYTARPRVDRERILSSHRMPLNIFLVDDEYHAQGLVVDLSGERDLWRVRISSRYLTRTLDSGVKYYQLTTRDAPMDVELID